ncbi:Aste57867_17834 [Aphanomyces stellatus]|uniref:Aste57867_17834 protein n=1 Tax=Aphanomyces stellatus TaxID=120398 RepID=A0A485L8M2_9STRA|nr:hypothetical protein As57867_017773 [Aphanomyces stellatus]VFT94577.1 Aste57867_17834 [Aphanomyces stellatus]
MTSLPHSSSARALVGVREAIKKTLAPPTSPTHQTPPHSAVSGFYLSVLDSAKPTSSTSSTTPKPLHDRMKASSIGLYPRDGLLASIDGLGLAMHSVRALLSTHLICLQAEALSNLGVARGDVHGIVSLMRAKKQDVAAQIVCVHELLLVVRHDPSDYTLHSLVQLDVLPLLLGLMREFRFHALLQTDIMHVLMLLAKLTVEHAQILLRESAGTLIAKTMALHPVEDRLQQYAISLLYALRTTMPSTTKATTHKAYQVAFFDNEPATPTAKHSLWEPVTPNNSCQKHTATPLEPYQLVSAKSHSIAERSRTPELSQSKLRRALASPKIPLLSPHCTLITQASDASPPLTLSRPESCPAFDKLTIDVQDPSKPWSAQPSTRRETTKRSLVPMSPSLAAYRSSPLFVEPANMHERIDRHWKPFVKKLTKPPCAVAAIVAGNPPSHPNEAKAKADDTKVVSPAESLSQHRAAKCLQRYFRRILKHAVGATQDDGDTLPQMTSSSNDVDGLNAALGERDDQEYILRHIQAHFCRGLAHHTHHKYTLARDAYDAALDLKATISFASLVANVGATFLSQGAYDKALVAFDQAEALQPNHPKVLYNSGLAHWHLGHPTTAAAKFTSVLAVAPSHTKAIYALHVLKTKFDIVVA